MIGVPVVTVEWTTVEPPKTDCSATKPALTPTASVMMPEPVRTASRPAISLPSAVAGTSTPAAPDAWSSAACSAATFGATTWSS